MERHAVHATAGMAAWPPSTCGWRSRNKVAEVKLRYDVCLSRAASTTGPDGHFSDKYAIVGCYWPPHFVMLELALTLEPFKIVSTRSYTYDTEEYHPEPRCGRHRRLALQAGVDRQHQRDGSGLAGELYRQDLLPDHQDVGKGGSVSSTMAVGTRRGATSWWPPIRPTRSWWWMRRKAKWRRIRPKTSKIPYPGRGANWIILKALGPVLQVRQHLGQGSLVTIGHRPAGPPRSSLEGRAGHPVIRRRQPVPQVLHPNSPCIWVDFGLNSDEVIQRTVCVYRRRPIRR